MKVIRPNCRVQFSAEDIDFLVSVLGRKESDADSLVRLLADEESRDLILDDDHLYQAILENPGCLRISDHLYFYVLVRRGLRRAGIDDRDVADYVAEVLCEFSRQDRAECRPPGHPKPLEYLFEMLGALEKADDRTSFYLRTHIGNHSLFMSGIFPERIRYRAEYRGCPDLSYYQALGKANFRVASDHRLAAKYSLTTIFLTLADQFETARLALNDVSNRLFFLSGEDNLKDPQIWGG